MYEFDYSKLKGRITEVYSSRTQFAKDMGMSENSLSYKLNKKRDFTLSEIIKAVELLKINDINEYFFTPTARE